MTIVAAAGLGGQRRRRPLAALRGEERSQRASGALSRAGRCARRACRHLRRRRDRADALRLDRSAALALRRGDHRRGRRPRLARRDRRAARKRSRRRQLRATSDAAIEQIAGVIGVHDLHVWSIGSGSHALSAHVLLDDRRLSEATEVLAARSTTTPKRTSASTTLRFNSNARAARSWCGIEGRAANRGAARGRGRLGLRRRRRRQLLGRLRSHRPRNAAADASSARASQADQTRRDHRPRKPQLRQPLPWIS